MPSDAGKSRERQRRLDSELSKGGTGHVAPKYPQRDAEPETISYCIIHSIDFDTETIQVRRVSVSGASHKQQTYIDDTPLTAFPQPNDEPEDYLGLIWEGSEFDDFPTVEGHICKLYNISGTLYVEKPMPSVYAKAKDGNWSSATE